MADRSTLNLVGAAVTGENVGGGAGIFKDKNFVNNLRFKSLCGIGVNIIEDADYITISGGAGGGGGIPGGADTQIQYNNAGAFGGDTSFTWNDSTKQLNVTGDIALCGTSILRTEGVAAESVEVGRGADANSTICSVAVGYQACAKTGGNVSIGYRAGSTNAAVGTAAISIGYRANQCGFTIGANSMAIGRFASARSAYSIAIGDGADAIDLNSVSMGRNASTCNGSVALGPAAVGEGISSVAIGISTTASATNTVGIGFLAQATTNNSIAIGDRAGCTTGTKGTCSIAIGYRGGGGTTGTANLCTDAIAIGRQTQAAGVGSIAIGSGADATNSSGRAIAIGNNSYANGYHGISIGLNSQAGGASSIGIGRDSCATSTCAVAIGAGLTNSTPNSVGFGWSGSNTAPTILFTDTDSCIRGTNPRLAIGHSSPSARIDISATTACGGFRLRDGNETDGYVLTSDANGYGTWVASSGGGTGSTSPAGANGEIQFNSGGTFGATAGLCFVNDSLLAGYANTLTNSSGSTLLGNFGYIGNSNCSFVANGGYVNNDTTYSNPSNNNTIATNAAFSFGRVYGSSNGFAVSSGKVLGDFGVAFGRSALAYGISSFVGGWGLTGTSANCVAATGLGSFNWSANCNVTQDEFTQPLTGASAPFSAILGGVDNIVSTNATGATILGGCNININGATYAYHTAVSNLMINETPNTNNANSNALVWNSSTKKLEINTTLGGGGGGTGATAANNGLTLNGNTVSLGGTLTGDTLVCTTGYGIVFGSDTPVGKSGCAYATATGEDAVSIGKGNNADGLGSFAGGCASRATGDTAFAFGCNSDAFGTYSVAIGDRSEAYGVNSAAFNGGTVFGENSFVAGGTGARACGNNSVTLIGGDADGENSFAVNGDATGTSSVAMQGGQAFGTCSFAFGSAATASGINSFAFGSSTSATGACSHAQGTGTNAFGDLSFAGGCQTTTCDDYAFAFGRLSQAVGIGSVALGLNTRACNNFAFTSGVGSSSSNRYLHACGCTAFNHSFNNSLQGSGCGANGNFSAILGGANQDANGQSSGVFVGAYNRVSGNCSTIIGGRCNRNAGFEASILAGRDNCISGTSQGHVIVGGVDNIIGDGFYNFIGGTQISCVLSSDSSIILSSLRGEINSCGEITQYNTIIGTCCSTISCDSSNSSIVSSRESCIDANTFSRNFNMVMGSNTSTICNGTTTTILAGAYNSSCLATRSAIIGGCNNCLFSSDAVMLATCNVTASTSYNNHAMVSNLAIFDEPLAGGSDDLLVWDSGDSKVKKVTQASVSDFRLKEDIVELSNVTSSIKNIPAYVFKFNGLSPYSGSTQYGVLAQEIETEFPHLVKDNYVLNETVYKTVDYKQLVPILLQAIKELEARVEQLEL